MLCTHGVVRRGIFVSSVPHGSSVAVAARILTEIMHQGQIQYSISPIHSLLRQVVFDISSYNRYLRTLIKRKVSTQRKAMIYTASKEPGLNSTAPHDSRSCGITLSVTPTVQSHQYDSNPTIQYLRPPSRSSRSRPFLASTKPRSASACCNSAKALLRSTRPGCDPLRQ